jgi:glycosyltransferase involved in cell wall biosynthesis
MTVVKGGEQAIAALPRAARSLDRPLRLVLAGDGPALHTWQQRARRIGATVEFPGRLSGTELDALRRQADLLLVPSLWPEPFGLVGIEAGCVGLPAAGFASGGIPDWLVPGETGESAPADPPTPGGLAAAIVRALRDPAHHQRLREGAWRMAWRYTLESHLDQLGPILERAAHG